MNAKRNAHNFRFDFCRTAALQIEFIYTKEYTWHPPTNQLNVIKFKFHWKSNLSLSKNNETCCKSYLFLSEYIRLFLNCGSDVTAFQIRLVCLSIGTCSQMAVFWNCTVFKLSPFELKKNCKSYCPITPKHLYYHSKLNFLTYLFSLWFPLQLYLSEGKFLLLSREIQR